MSDLLVLLLTVPTITAFVGWSTNWAAVKMIFHPERFRGIGPLGWQGILPRQSHKFATGIADMATENLISPREMAQRLDPEEMERLLESTLADQTQAMVQEAADIIHPGAWAMLPPPVQHTLVQQVQAQTRKLARDLFDQLQGISGELLDLHHLIYSQLSGENTRRLSRFTKEIGAQEFKFIEYYGGVFGFLIGLGQVGVWSAMQTWWLMPIVGAIVGIVTNWLAIQMIFRPQEPRTYLGVFRYQGLFPKRQKQIAADYGRITADEILTPRNLIRIVTEGEAGGRIALLVVNAISERVDQEMRKVQQMVPLQPTPDQIALIKARIVMRVVHTVPEVQPKLEAYLERKLAIGAMIEDKLGSLPKPEFERVLRGVFEEDELTLILVGGFLGGAVGALQGMLVLALNV